MLRNLIYQSIEILKIKVSEYIHFSGNSFFYCVIGPSAICEIFYNGDQEY